MKLDETTDMAYPRKYVENIIIGFEDPLNEHLIKLIGFDFSAEQRAHSRREIRTLLADRLHHDEAVLDLVPD
jgi:hypothetical protein